jgi:hypothetical protein
MLLVSTHKINFKKLNLAQLYCEMWDYDYPENILCESEPVIPARPASCAPECACVAGSAQASGRAGLRGARLWVLAAEGNNSLRKFYHREGCITIGTN